MKTTIDIVDDMYALLNVSDVQDALVDGEVFSERKPDGYQKDCIVINSLPVTGSQLQRAVINVNIHVRNLELTIGGQPDNSQPNRKRIKEISDVVIPIIKDAVINNTVTEIERVTMFSEENEHFLNIRVGTNSINL